jgi:hypothetical protein
MDRGIEMGMVSEVPVNMNAVQSQQKIGLKAPLYGDDKPNSFGTVLPIN